MAGQQDHGRNNKKTTLEEPYDEPRFAERRADTCCHREGHPRCRRDHSHLDEAVRRARDPVDREQPSHLPGNAIYHPRRRRIHKRRHYAGRDHSSEKFRWHATRPGALEPGHPSRHQGRHGAKPLAGSPNDTVTEGLDGLRDRLREYHGMGARFAKWRAVIISQTVCRASPVSVQMPMRWRATPRFARNSI